MTGKRVYEVLGDVNDKYITEAMEYKVKKKPIWLLKAAVAACLCIAILGGGLAFTVVAKERDYYKELSSYFDIVDQGDNPVQISKMHHPRGDSISSTDGYVLTITTDKTRYTVDEYIYITARIDNISDVEISFSANNERYGMFSISSFNGDDWAVSLYDTSYNCYDIDSGSFTKDEIKQIKLNPGEYYSQTFRFSAKYISRETDWKPVLADETLPLGRYFFSFLINSDRCGPGLGRINIEIVEEA